MCKECEALQDAIKRISIADNPEGDSYFAELESNPSIRLHHTCGREWPQFVNVYRVDQVFGGSEEGGWWYDCYEPLSSVEVNNEAQREKAKALLAEVYELDNQENWERERIRGRTSCAGGYDVQLFVEAEFADYRPKRKPHYE